MARPANETASPSTLAPALCRWLAANGAAPDVVRDELATRDEAPATPRELAALFEAALLLLADPHVGLRLPTELVYRRYDAVALASQAAQNPADVLRLHARFAPLVVPQLEARVEEGAEDLVFSAHVRGHPRGLGAAVDEYLLALVLGRCRRGGARVPVKRIAFVSPRPRDIAPLHVAFGTRELAFGEEACVIELAKEDAARALPGHDPALIATAEHLAAAALASVPQTSAIALLVAAKIEAALPGPVTADGIAAVLHLSARTLQRRLESEGTRFSEVLDSVRERLARQLLADPIMPLGEIAYRAGFADLATFSRAFKRWTGVPPGTFRRAKDS